MDLEVVTVGTELLLGFTLDGNTAVIGRLLSEIGCNVVRCTSVPDDETAIRDAVSGGLSRVGTVVVTGGLGPTSDDVTKKAVSGIFDAPLELDTGYLEKLEVRFARLGRGPMPSSNRSQAEIPRGATTLTNACGTAPGLWLDGVPGTVIMLPGVPLEMRSLMETEVVPRLRRVMLSGHGKESVTKSRTLRTTGVSESRLAEDLGDVERCLGDVTLSYLPGVEGVDLRLTIRNVSDAEATRALEHAQEIVSPKLAARLYGTDSITLAEVLIQWLRDAQMSLAVAESCTGGLIGTRLTSVPGASDVFSGGIICYGNASKIRDLGVPSSMLAESGAVSEPVARAMVEGICERFQVEVGVAVTGVAGPEGGSDEKPVGTVWLAAKAGSSARAVKQWFPGKRREVQERSAQGALDLVRKLLDAN
jgi:nicotinamide-nucleotide amidase